MQGRGGWAEGGLQGIDTVSQQVFRVTPSGPGTQKKAGLNAIANSSRWHCVFMAASWDVWRPVV